MRSFLCWYLMIYLDVLLELPVFKLQPWDSRTTERFWNPMDKLWNEAPCERSLIINLQWISLTHEQLHFHHGSVRGVICDLINVLGSLSVILQRVSYCHRTLSVKCIVVSLSRTSATAVRSGGHVVGLGCRCCRNFKTVQLELWPTVIMILLLVPWKKL